MTEPGLTVLVAARDEAPRIARTVAALREAFPEAEIVVADDGSRDGTASVASDAGARVVSLPRRGKGQALALAERECREGPLLLCDADLVGDLRPLVEDDADLAVARFARRAGGGLGLAKGVARSLIELRGGRRVEEPLSGQRALSARARAEVFPVAAGFGVETRMTIDALRAGLDVREVEIDLAHRATGRDLAGFVHRGRQLRDLLLATIAPQARSFRGLRLPLVGAVVGVAVPSVAPVAAVGLADDLWSGPERGFRAHLRGRRDDGHPQAGRHPAVGSLAHALGQRRAARVALRERPEPARHATREGAEGVPRSAPCSSAGARGGRSRWPSSSLPTIFAR